MPDGVRQEGNDGRHRGNYSLFVVNYSLRIRAIACLYIYFRICFGFLSSNLNLPVAVR